MKKVEQNLEIMCIVTGETSDALFVRLFRVRNTYDYLYASLVRKS